MATGGASRASVKGSDEFHPFVCSPCSRKSIDVGAEVYCNECGEYLCGPCHASHNSFAIMAAHTMLDRAQMEAKGPQTVRSHLTIPCDLHPSQMYTLFCEKHNQVCCSVCFPINHKSCNVKYILHVAKGAMQGPELNEFRRAMKEILNHLENIKKEREFDMQTITAEKTTEINKIHASIRQMIKQLEAIEKAAVNDVDRKFNEFKTKIESDLTMLGTMINTLNTKLDKLEKANDDTEKFVHMKICEEDKTSARKLVEDITARVGEEKLVFLIDERVEESIRKLRSLGQLVLDYRYAVTPEGQHHVKTKEDGFNVFGCAITDICLAEDGSLFMTDWTNQCLKRLDQSYMVIDRLKLDDNSESVCCVSASQVAVTLAYCRRVQLITLKHVMSKSRSFNTTDNCRGITYHAGRLYIACGGWRMKGEGPGHIAVYTISGTLVRKLETDSQGKLFQSIPVGVAVRSSDDVILVCDRDKGLVALRPDGQRLWTLKCKDLGVGNVVRVNLDSRGRALVSCRSSGKVVLVSWGGKRLGEVLTARDGLTKPQALYFDTRQSRLIVGMENNNQVSVFKLA